MPLLHLEDEEVGDLVTHLVETFRKGVNSFIEELDAKLRHEFEALERKEVQLRVERQALDEMRRCLRQDWFWRQRLLQMLQAPSTMP